jgi:sortase B
MDNKLCSKPKLGFAAGLGRGLAARLKRGVAARFGLGAKLRARLKPALICALALALLACAAKAGAILLDYRRAAQLYDGLRDRVFFAQPPQAAEAGGAAAAGGADYMGDTGDGGLRNGQPLADAPRGDVLLADPQPPDGQPGGRAPAGADGADAEGARAGRAGAAGQGGAGGTAGGDAANGGLGGSGGGAREAGVSGSDGSLSGGAQNAPGSAAPAAPAASAEPAAPAADGLEPESERAAQAEPVASAAPAPTPEPVPAAYDMVYVDFGALKAENPDCVGWLWIEGLDVSYPVMQSGDDGKYLAVAFDGSRSGGGSLFLDSRNSPGFGDPHSMIYGHNMLDNSMFGRLDEYASQERFDRDPFVYLFTPECSYVYRIFSHYVTTMEMDSYRADFSDGDGFAAYVGALRRHSWLKTGAAPEAAGAARVLTLSTCVGDDYRRRVVHAALIGSAPPPAPPL